MIAGRGILVSAAAHILLLLLAGHGLPFLSAKPVEVRPPMVAIDLRGFSKPRKGAVKKPAKTETAKAETKPAPAKPTPPKRESPPPPAAQPPKAETKKPEKKPEPKKPEPKPTEAKKPDPKQPDKNKPEPKQPTEDQFASLLKTLTPPKPVPQPAGPAGSEDAPEDTPLSDGEHDALAAQIGGNWNIDPGRKDIQAMLVRLRVIVGPDGTVQSVDVAEAIGDLNNLAYLSFVESAKRAILLSSPLAIPLDKIPADRTIIFTFDPKDML